jgi:hypothetical protein
MLMTGPSSALSSVVSSANNLISFNGSTYSEIASPAAMHTDYPGAGAEENVDLSNKRQSNCNFYWVSWTQGAFVNEVHACCRQLTCLSDESAKASEGANADENL